MSDAETPDPDVYRSGRAVIVPGSRIRITTMMLAAMREAIARGEDSVVVESVAGQDEDDAPGSTIRIDFKRVSGRAR